MSRARALQHALLGLMVLLLDARADDASFPSTPGLDALGSGAEIYQHICQGCHMAQGQGAIGAGYYPALAGNTALAAWKYPALTVLAGRHGMPPFGLPAAAAQEQRTTHLSDQQVADVVNYVRTHFGNAYADPVSAAQVAALPPRGRGRGGR